MRNRNLKQRFMRSVMALAMGGTAFQLSGCDPDVRSALLGGLAGTTNSLADALIAAFFISLEDDSSGGTGGVTTGF